MNAARDLVAERGVAGTSLEDVRRRAHVSQSQIYLYFSDRDDLMRAVSEATCESVMEVQSHALARFDSLKGIERYLDAMVDLQERVGAHGGCPIGSLVGQLAEHDEAARLALAEGFDRWEDGLRKGLGVMAEREELRPGADPALLASQTLAALQGGLLLTQVRRDPGQLRAAADGVLALIRAQLAA